MSSTATTYNNDKTLEEIYDSALKFLESLYPTETYKKITLEGKKIINAKFGTIFLAQNKRLIRTYTSGPASYKLKLRKNGFTYKAFETAKPAIISIEEYKKAHPDLPPTKIKTIFNVPLTYHNKTTGVLNLYSENIYPNRKKTLNTLKLYGSLASLAVIKAQLYNEVQSALETRRVFINLVAHELRTPLTTINGYAQLFNQKLAKNEMPEKRWAGTLQFETLRLSMLVNELLEINKIKSGGFKYKFKRLNVVKILERTIKEIKLKYPKHKIKLNLQKSKRYITEGDSNKLLQAFIDILNNSAKYSTFDKTINIYLEKNKKITTIIFKDEGKGISKKDQRHIFEEFFRGRNAKTDGFGIGLFVCKQIIEDHNGSIEIKSQINIGTEVKIKIPNQ